MSDENLHNNPWAEKMQHLAVPDVNDTWNGMHAMLEREMPSVRNRNNLKWALLLLLLLIVTGVCNCPGLKRGNRMGDKDTRKTSLTNVNVAPSTTFLKDSTKDKTSNKHTDPMVPNSIKTSDSGAFRISNPTGPVNKANPEKGSNNSSGLNSASDYPRVKKEKRIHPVITGKHPIKQPVFKTDAKPLGGDSLIRSENGSSRRNNTKGNILLNKNTASSEKTSNTANKDHKTKELINDTGNVTTRAISTDTGNIEPATPLPDTSAVTIKDTTVDSLKKADSASVKVPSKDSAGKQKERGFVLAMGVNQFLALGQQQYSSYNSNGTTGVLADYIPVPQLRYHVNGKLYLQMEAQFNAPQYTGNILARQSPPDSSRPGPPLQSSVYIKKLFYFNLPFSMHYSPSKNFYLGAGLQFSQLRNAVGLYENKRVRNTAQDTLNTAKFQSLRSDDTTYSLLKTNEWRFLIDANYQWRRLTLGLRYNQAFNYFINVRISNAAITQARNNSLQLYLRYDLWDGRKKLPISGKAR